jgi:hypothetical protein
MKLLALAFLVSATGFGPTKPKLAKHKTIYIVRHGEKIDGNLDADELQHEAQCLSEKGWARSYNLKSVFGRGAAEANGFKTPEAIFSCNYGEPLDCRDHNGMFRTQQLVAALADSLGIKVDNSTGFIPTLCGMIWNEDSKAGYSDHKIGASTDFPRKQPEKYRKIFEAWLDAEPSCSGEPTCTGPNGEAACHVRGFGPKDVSGSYSTRADDGTCCNQDAADKMLAKLRDVDVILAGWEHANINYLAAALAKQNYDEFQTTLTTAGLTGGWNGGDYDRIYEMIFDAETLEYVGGNYTKHQGFEWPEGVGYEGHKAYLGPQSYCGAVAESSIPSYPIDGTVYGDATGDRFGHTVDWYDHSDRITKRDQPKNMPTTWVVDGSDWVGPAVGRLQPDPSSTNFGKIVD